MWNSHLLYRIKNKVRSLFVVKLIMIENFNTVLETRVTLNLIYSFKSRLVSVSGDNPFARCHNKYIIFKVLFDILLFTVFKSNFFFFLHEIKPNIIILKYNIRDVYLNNIITIITIYKLRV